MQELILPEGWQKKLTVISSKINYRIFLALARISPGESPEEQLQKRLILEYGQEIKPILNREGRFRVRGSYVWTESHGKAWSRLEDDHTYYKWQTEQDLLPDLTRTEAALLKELRRKNPKLISEYQRKLLQKHTTFGPYSDIQKRLNSFKIRKKIREKINETSPEPYHSNS